MISNSVRNTSTESFRLFVTSLKLEALFNAALTRLSYPLYYECCAEHRLPYRYRVGVPLGSTFLSVRISHCHILTPLTLLTSEITSAHVNMIYQGITHSCDD